MRFSGPRQSTDIPREFNAVKPPAPNQAQPSPEETGARELLDKTLRIKARLENEGAKIWGEELLTTSYGEAQALLQEADSHFNAQRYDHAAAGYKKTIEAFEQLETSRTERLQKALQDGSRALETFDAESARRYFEIALAANAASSEAAAGLQRVRLMPQVLAYVKKQDKSVIENGLWVVTTHPASYSKEEIEFQNKVKQELPKHKIPLFWARGSELHNGFKRY